MPKNDRTLYPALLAGHRWAQHGPNGTTQTSAFITQLMESSQSDHYRETVKKSLNYNTWKHPVLIRSSFTYLLRNTYTDGFVQNNYESHIQHNRPGTTFLDMQRNAQMNLKDWMWINHLWLNYTDAEEREPHIITSHTVSLLLCLSVFRLSACCSSVLSLDLLLSLKSLKGDLKRLRVSSCPCLFSSCLPLWQVILRICLWRKAPPMPYERPPAVLTPPSLARDEDEPDRFSWPQFCLGAPPTVREWWEYFRNTEAWISRKTWLTL